MAISPIVREIILRRGGYSCEAPHCNGVGTEIHHKLPRGRGANALDKVRETYHLILLCVYHHRQVESERTNAYEDGLLISGYVMWDKTLNRPTYRGPDEYLSSTYPESE